MSHSQTCDMMSMFSFLQIRQLCNVHYRKFDFTLYPKHVRELTTYAFKPLIVHVSLNSGLFSANEFCTSILFNTYNFCAYTYLHCVPIKV